MSGYDLGSMLDPNLPQPRDTIARTPSLRTLAITIFVSLSGLSMTMLPKPMYTGHGPSRRKAARSASGV